MAIMGSLSPWIIFLVAISYSSPANGKSAGLPVVRNLSAAEAFNLPGFSHITVAGAILHGFKEIEVWLETAAPGGHTPIHRHECEEVVIVLKGSGTLYVANDGSPTPQEFPFYANSSVRVPPNSVHQVWNTNPHEDLNVIVVISKPPLKSFVYGDWSAPHDSAKEMFPLIWDKPTRPTNDEL